MSNDAYQRWLDLGQNYELGRFAVTPVAFSAGYSAGLAEHAPVDMILHCPKCGTQHVDAPMILMPDDTNDMPVWNNPPHRSHLCAGCGHVWRPADVPTNGIAAIETKGSNDNPIVEPVLVPTVDVTRMGDSRSTSERALLTPPSTL